MTPRRVNVAWQRFTALLSREDGQDLIEYALLTAAIGFAGAAAFALLSNNVNDAYSSWDTNVNDLWVPAEPEAE